ncbi:hypothetical protein QOT17_015305 [Balamuthia mandrillaris]
MTTPSTITIAMVRDRLTVSSPVSEEVRDALVISLSDAHDVQKDWVEEKYSNKDTVWSLKLKGWPFSFAADQRYYIPNTARVVDVMLKQGYALVGSTKENQEILMWFAPARPF